MPEDKIAFDTIEGMVNDDMWWLRIWLTSTPFLIMLLFYLLSSLGVGVIAKTFGRNFWGWMLFSLFITPVIAGLIVFIMKERPVARVLPPPM